MFDQAKAFTMFADALAQEPVPTRTKFEVQMALEEFQVQFGWSSQRDQSPLPIGDFYV